MKKITLMLAASAAGACSIMGFSGIAHAETHITSGEIIQDTFWDKTGSPYILDANVTVYPDVTLQIGPGTVVMNDPSSTDPDEQPGISVNGGALDIEGTRDARVSFKGLTGTYVFQGDLDMNNADIDGDGVTLEDARARISTSTMTGGFDGVVMHDSSLELSGSRIYANDRGITVNPSGNQLLIGRLQQRFGTGGIGNALGDLPAAASSSVTVSGSSIMGNSQYGLRNMSTKLTVQAENDWWGSAAGPSAIGMNEVSGQVDDQPWLTSEPPLDPGKPACCSSILFIPGIEASRLFDTSPGAFGVGTTTTKLWEPQGNALTSRLYLNADGSSIDPAVYSGDPIDDVLGIADIYGTFMDYLNGLARNGTINDWKAFGYDWRKPIDEVVAGTEKKATTTEYLLDEVDRLAQGSKTGKVTIIAHSNGGLVAKYLVKVLNDLGKSSLIDNVISVAVPYLGTPQAILGLLHGYGESFGYGLLLNSSVARGLAANMASAYSLLPSTEYYSRVLGPTIAFASTTMPGLNDGSYPQTISTHDGQDSFIADAENARQSPSFTDTNDPIKGNQTLLASADALHSKLDSFVWPVGIDRWALVGWNVPTSKSVNYYDRAGCIQPIFGLPCGPVTSFTASTTAMGDGTVVAPSAAYDDGNVVSLDLKQIGNDEGRGYDHSNILEASSTREVINTIVTGSAASSLMNGLSSIPGASAGEPDYSKEPTYLVLSTHSPVQLNVYDSSGNHTGLIPLPTNSGVEDGLYTRFETGIPGSNFDISGDSADPETYVYLPDDSGQTYSVTMNGIGVGEFTYDVERVRGGETLDKAEFADMPVTPLTVATTSITTDVSGSTVMTSLSSSTPPVSIDVDGDGSSDIQAKANAVPDPIAFLEALRKTVDGLIPGVPHAVSLDQRIGHIETLVKKGKLSKALTISNKVDTKIQHLKVKDISDEDKQEIVDLVEQFIGQFGQ